MSTLDPLGARTRHAGDGVNYHDQHGAHWIDVTSPARRASTRSIDRAAARSASTFPAAGSWLSSPAPGTPASGQHRGRDRRVRNRAASGPVRRGSPGHRPGGPTRRQKDRPVFGDHMTQRSLHLTHDVLDLTLVTEPGLSVERVSPRGATAMLAGGPAFSLSVQGHWIGCRRPRRRHVPVYERPHRARHAHKNRARQHSDRLAFSRIRGQTGH